MRFKKISAAVMAAFLGFSSLAVHAQPRGEDSQQSQQRQRASGAQGAQDRQDRQQGRSDRHYPAQASRGAGPQHDYFRGDRLPPEARRGHVVDNWRDHRLDPPPQGHQWVRVGTDFVLIAVATGIITQIILGSQGY